MKRVIVWGAILIWGVFFILFHSRTGGYEILRYIAEEDFPLVTVEKTCENSDGARSIAAHDLTASEVTQLYGHLAVIQLKSVQNNSVWLIPTESAVKYYVSFINDDGLEICRLEFYDDDALSFNYRYLTKPPAYERYKIIDTDIVDFFESIL